jgi:hypothetical protein
VCSSCGERENDGERAKGLSIKFNRIYEGIMIVSECGY